METVYISENAYPETIELIEGMGIEVNIIRRDIRLGEFTGDHPDLRLCPVGGDVIFAAEEEFRPDYPENAAYCAAVVGEYFIHRLDITAPRLLRAAEGLIMLNVRQGYAKCSTVIVDGRSLITSDEGIYAAAKAAGGLEALFIAKGGVLLPGYDTGFLGGAAGRVRDGIIFNGSLSSHPDAGRIRDFIASRGLKIWDIPGLPLRDTGSIIYCERNGKICQSTVTE